LKEEVRIIRTWSEEESQQYVERFRGYRGDMRYRKCGIMPASKILAK